MSDNKQKTQGRASTDQETKTQAGSTSTQVVKHADYKTREITTTLEGKRELFRLLTLAESLKMPLLFIGPAGVGKTQSVSDYANSKVDGKDHKDKIFFIEVDEDTRPSAIKGTVDHKRLFEDKVFEMTSPVPDSDIIIVNEVDKATSGFRNSMLGVMNERKIYYGKEVVDCNWKLFVATCNEIPEDEIGNHFWDRFPIRYTVSRASEKQLLKIAMEGLTESKYSLNVPSLEQISEVKIPEYKLKVFVEIAYSSCSDRTITKAADIIRAISIIWDCSINKAIFKATELLIGATAAKKISRTIQSPEVRQVINEIETMMTISDPKQSRAEAKRIMERIKKRHEAGELSKEEYDEIVSTFHKV